MNNYVGFSSIMFEQDKELIMKDVNLVKQDLLNHIFTRRGGDRVMMVNFGTRIQDIQFEPLDDVALLIIKEDLTEVFNYDPRVDLVELVIAPIYEQSTVMVFAKLNFKYLNFTDTLSVNIQFIDS